MILLLTIRCPYLPHYLPVNQGYDLSVEHVAKMLCYSGHLLIKSEIMNEIFMHK